MANLRPGDRAPAFTAAAHDGRTIRSADYLGKQTVVLFFYPKDGTPVCTAEACGFRDAYEDFVRAGAAVIGVSADSTDRHQRFAADRNLPFTLVSDADGALRKAFGVRKTLGLLPGRVTFVIDRDGVVRHVFRALLNAGGHVQQALKIVRELAEGQKEHAE